MIQDEQIMLKVQGGNIELLGLLFERYQHELYNFYLKTVVDRDLSADLTQTVFLRIMKYKKSFNPNHKFRTWMYQIARNVRIDHMKADGFYVHMVDLEDLPEHMEMNDKPFQSAKVSKEVVQRALNHLSVEKRELITHSLLLETPISELADLYQISENNAKVRLHRAIKELREVYRKIA